MAIETVTKFAFRDLAMRFDPVIDDFIRAARSNGMLLDDPMRKAHKVHCIWNDQTAADSYTLLACDQAILNHQHVVVDYASNGVLHSMSSSQRFVCKWFSGSQGRLLDVGAYDAVNESNSLQLLLSGWHGCLIEPSPWVYDRMAHNLSLRGISDRCIMLQSALVPDDDHRDTIEFYETEENDGSFGRGWGSIYPTLAEDIIDKQPYKQGFKSVKMIDVPCMTPRELCFQFGVDWDFISIDANGIDHELAQAWPWDMMSNLSLICMETGTDPTATDAFMQQAGFQRVQRLDFDAFYAR